MNMPMMYSLLNPPCDGAFNLSSVSTFPIINHLGIELGIQDGQYWSEVVETKLGKPRESNKKIHDET